MAEPLSAKEKGSILALRKVGFSYRTIAEEVNRSVAVCHKIIKHDESPPPEKQRGKPKKVTERDVRHIARCVSTTHMSAKNIQEKLH
jgi:transposase